MAELRKTRRGYEEVPPSRCVSCGAAFVPGKVIVGSQQCSCAQRFHRTHCCPCGYVTLTPAGDPGCRQVNLDGR